MSNIPGKIKVLNFTLINDWGLSTETRSEVWPLIVGTSIYEGVFTPCMYGIAKVRDSYNLYSTLPITKNTYVKITLQDPTTNKVISNIYKIYKVSNVEQETAKLQTYILHFTSIEMFNSMRVRINKHVTGNLPKAIKEIHQTFSKRPIEVDDDAAKGELFLPMLTGYDSIKLLMESSKWRASVPDYSYWETFSGFHCKSLSNCVLSSPVHDFSTNAVLSRDLYTDDFSYADYIKIDDISVPQTFGSLDSLYQGFDGSTIFSYDPLTGTSYFDALGDEPLARVYAFPDRSRDYSALSKRIQLLRQISNTYYIISVPGLLGRSSGDMANVTIYNGNNMQEKDTTLSGKRLICGIVHIISNDEYQQNITLGDYYLGG